MPFTDNDGVRLHYEIVGSGPPVLLRHGYGMWLEPWIDCGYVEALQGDYQCILMDARGHGQSGMPHQPEAYSMALETGDVLAVLDELGIGQAIYWGYSYGGRVGWALAHLHAERLRGLIIGGSTPVSKPPEQVAAWAEGMAQLFSHGVEAWVASARAAAGSLWQPEWAEGFRQADLEALIAIANWSDPLDLVSGLPAVEMPVLAYCGERDDNLSGMRHAVLSMRNATWVELSELDHLGAVLRSEFILPHVQAFLERVTL